MFFSIVIPVQRINDYIFETCSKIKELNNKNFEILIFSDEVGEDREDIEKTLGARIIPSGKVSPAIKRDMAMQYAKGDVLAFIDDDAYPEKNWLDIAERYLSQGDDVAAIGGTQLTPSQDSFWQKVSGAVFLSPLSGSALIRYWHGKNVHKIDDWPSVNFLIKKEDFIKVGGFDSHYWPGEDTKLCRDVVKKLNKKILYVPNLIVYHHRRAGLKKHLKQIGNYGLHRGYFAKKFPETSRKIQYFIPSTFVLFVTIGSVSAPFSDAILKLFLFVIGIYFLGILFSTISIWWKIKNFLVSMMTIPYLVLTHIWYGTRFIQGFVFTKTLRSKLGK